MKIELYSKFVSGVCLCMLYALVILLGGCASTQYGQLQVSKLADAQLVEELVSAERELGIQTDYRSALSAIDTSPRPVVTSASTTYAGDFNARYNNANSTLYGSFIGSGYTAYHYVDANAGARFGQGLALLINASNATKLENRRKAVLTEISRRREARENMERIMGQFLLAHPAAAENRDLFIACLLIAQHRTEEPLVQLQQAAEMMLALPTNRWVGWVEAHGDPHYPYGVVVGSYFMDTTWDGHVLTGKGKSSDGSDMTLTAHGQSDGTLEGSVRSQTMESKFTGRMIDTALCVVYTGTENGQPIRGITWAFRRGEMNGLQRPSASVGQVQGRTFSGRYIGNGKSVNNAIEQPYQIVLDVDGSGEITFVCTSVIDNQQAVVRGKGVVDSNGNVIVQNEFGDTGHGNIIGKILNAGGQNADGSIQSYFTAQKQE